jgi:DNA-binding response OmpR family regulator
MDIFLKQANGFELCKAIKNMIPNQKIMIVSSRKRESDIIESFSLGVSDYMLKPIVIKELLVRMRKILS